MKNILIPSLAICALTLAFCPTASASKSSAEVCKSLKNGAYLTNDKFNLINGEINLGRIYASWADFDYSGIKYYLIAPKGYSDGAMPGSNGFRVELREAAFSCRGFAIFEARFGISTRHFGPGSFSFSFPLALLDKDSLPANVRAPPKIVGELLNVGWLSPLLNEKVVSGIELGTAATGNGKATFINSGNSILAIEEWSSTDEQNNIVLTKNHCADIELKPSSVCEAEFKWNNSKGDKTLYSSWRVYTKNSDRVLEITVEERDGKLSLGVTN